MPPPTAEALVLTAPRQLEIRQFDIPDLDDDGAIIKVEACGLCGTDHEQFTGHIRGGHEFIPGHEIVGTVESMGARAGKTHGIKLGDRVAVEPLLSCKQCPACLSGQSQLCERHGQTAFYGSIDVRRAPGLWGGYATHTYIGPDTNLLPVPSNVDPVLATLFNPLGAGIRWGVTIPETAPGDVVAVLGPGIRGLCACIAAKEAGAGFVVLTGAGPADEERLSIASSFGGDLVVDIAKDKPHVALRRAIGGLADVVIDVTARAPKALGQAVSLARAGGTIVVAGVRGSDETPGFKSDHIVFKELTIKGALGVDTISYRRAFEILAAERYPFAELPRWIASLSEAPDLLACMAGEGKIAPPVHGVVVP